MTYKELKAITHFAMSVYKTTNIGVLTVIQCMQDIADQADLTLKEYIQAYSDYIEKGYV